MTSTHFTQRSGSAGTPPKELEAIHAFAAARELDIIAIRPNDNHWFYWLRGKLLLSNRASMYVITAQSRDSRKCEMHIATTRRIFSRTLDVKVLLEKVLA